MAESRPNRSTYRLNDSNYDFVWRTARDRSICMNEALNLLLNELRSLHVRRLRKRVNRGQVTAAVASR